jgi:glyoxylase-like metal-dependent hydrolase (beta-lactamase superfamily II)
VLLREGLHRVVAPLGERVVALYLLEGPEGILLWDTGVADSVTGTLLPYLADAGIDPARIRWAINSHCDFDHTGGNAALREAVPHVALFAGADDLPLVTDLDRLIAERYGEFRVSDGFDDPAETTAHIRAVTGLVDDVTPLTGGETFDLGDRRIVVLAAPGHSPGHLALWDDRSRALLISDATLGTTVPYADGSAAFPPTYRDTDDYLRTLTGFRAHGADLLLTAHYPLYEGTEVEGFLAASEQYVDVLDAAISRVLSTTEDLTTLEIVRLIAAEVGTWPDAAADYLVFPVTGNLERMQQRGLVRQSARGERRTWLRSAA